MYKFTKITSEEYKKATQGIDLMGMYHYPPDKSSDKKYALFYGKMLTVFGEPDRTSEFYENMYHYYIKAEDSGETAYFDIYGAAPCYSTPFFDAPTELQNRYIAAAKELFVLVDDAEPTDYTWSGEFEQLEEKVTYTVKNGEAAVEPDKGDLIAIANNY